MQLRNLTVIHRDGGVLAKDEPEVGEQMDQMDHSPLSGTSLTVKVDQEEGYGSAPFALTMLKPIPALAQQPHSDSSLHFCNSKRPSGTCEPTSSTHTGTSHGQHTLSIALGVAFPPKLSRKYSPALSHCPRLLSSLPSTRAALKVCRAARGRGFLQWGRRTHAFQTHPGVKTSVLAGTTTMGILEIPKVARYTSDIRALKMVQVSKMCYFTESRRRKDKCYAPLFFATPQRIILQSLRN